MPHRFPGQKEGEEIRYIVRKHWIIYLKIGLLVVTAAGLPLLGYLFLEFAIDMGANARRITTLFFLIYLEIVTLMVYIRWLEEEMDIMIVTNERVISIDQVSFLHRTISETELSQVQDVKHEAKGLLANLLGFGSLEVQTAAEKITFRIQDVPKPYEMGRCIVDLCNQYKHEFVKKSQQKPPHEHDSDAPPATHPLTSHEG